MPSTESTRGSDHRATLGAVNYGTAVRTRPCFPLQKRHQIPPTPQLESKHPSTASRCLHRGRLASEMGPATSGKSLQEHINHPTPCTQLGHAATENGWALQIGKHALSLCSSLSVCVTHHQKSHRSGRLGGLEVGELCSWTPRPAAAPPGVAAEMTD